MTKEFQQERFLSNEASAYTKLPAMRAFKGGRQFTVIKNLLHLSLECRWASRDILTFSLWVKVEMDMRRLTITLSLK